MPAIGGLGIVATRVLHKGDEVAGAVVDSTCDDARTLSVCDRGVLLGPLALANSACRRCANAKFSRRRSGLWVIVVTKRIARSAEVLVPYAQHAQDGNPLECACGEALAEEAVSAGSESESEAD